MRAALGEGIGKEDRRMVERVTTIAQRLPCAPDSAPHIAELESYRTLPLQCCLLTCLPYPLVLPWAFGLPVVILFIPKLHQQVASALLKKHLVGWGEMLLPVAWLSFPIGA